MAAVLRTGYALRVAGAAVGACSLAAWFATCAEYDSSLLAYSHRSDAATQDTAPPEDVPSLDGPDADDAPDDAVAEPPADTTVDVTEAESGSVPCDPSCTDPTVLRPPCPPDMPDPPTQGEPLVFAVHTVRAGMSKAKMNDWNSIGIDLDCLWTKQDGTPSMCKSPSADPSVVQDGDLGRDNSFAHNVGGAIRLMEMFGLLSYDVEEDFNTSIDQGHSSMLFALENFGGGTDDPQVLVSFYTSRGTYDSTGTTPVPALWDGNDLWTIVRDSLTPTNQPKYVDDTAYVTNNRIVGHLPDGVPLRITGGDGVLDLSLTNSVFVLEMSSDHEHIVSGVLAGVWYTPAAMSAIDSYAAQAGVCADQPMYAAARDVLAKASDIRLDLKPAPTLECNAMSIGIAFTCDRAKLGAVIDPPLPSPSKCVDAGTDAN